MFIYGDDGWGDGWGYRRSSPIGCLVFLIIIGIFFWMVNHVEEKSQKIKMEQDYFSFMAEIINNTDTSVQRNGQNMILTEISTGDLNKYKSFLASKGFSKWKRVSSPSKRFQLKDHSNVLYKGVENRPVIYSVGGSMKNMQIPVILLDEKQKILYCVLATEFTR